MKPCSHISSHREWPTLEGPIGNKGEKKIQQHNRLQKADDLGWGRGRYIWPGFVFAGQLFLEWLTFLLWISFILTNVSSSVFFLIYLFIFPPTGGASEKPICSQPCRLCCQMFSSALGGRDPPKRILRPESRLHWDEKNLGHVLYSILSHDMFSSQLDFFECSRSWMGTEARFSECYLYASLMRIVWLYFPLCFIHRELECPLLSSDRL